MAKGRNRDLITKRDEFLVRRYYYWTEVRRLRFDDALKVLSNQEFFISEDRILSIIRNAGKIDGSAPRVPKVRMPKLTFKQLSLFTDEELYPVGQIHRDSKT